MDDELTHELSAAYALNALSEEDMQIFEEHLRHCATCRADVGDFRDAASMLAYAANAAVPRSQLRDRVIERARQQSRSAEPARRWRTGLIPPAIAATALAAAIALATWAVLLRGDLRTARSPGEAQASVVRLLADPDTRQIPLSPRQGRLLVAPDHAAALVLEHAQPLPATQTYEAWVTLPNGTALPAGLFRGGQTRVVVPLTIRVPPGARVMTTIEPASGSRLPTGPVQVEGEG